MWLELVQNLTLLVALSALYTLVARLRQSYEIWGKICMGFLFGCVTIAGMMRPFHYTPGIIYDGRSIILTLAGLFGGGTCVIITSIIAGFYRTYLGGPGIWAGVATILVTALLGLFFRRIADNHPERYKPISLYGIGIVTHLAMLACQLLLPWPIGLAVIQNIWLPVILIFPVATLLIALLMKGEEERLVFYRKLVENQELLSKAQEIGKLGSWELDHNKNCLFWSEGVFRICGVNPENFAVTYEGFLEMVHPDDRETVEKAYTGGYSTESWNKYEIEHRIVRRDTGEIRIVQEKYGHQRNSAGRLVKSIGIIQDVTESKRAEQALRQSEHELRIRNEILAIFLSPSQENIYSEVLSVIQKATNSKHGMLAFVNENGNWSSITMDKKVWEQCRIPDKGIIFQDKKWMSVWDKADKLSLRSEEQFDLPEGHLPIKRCLVVPILYGKELIGIIVLANKETPYQEEDKALVATIARTMAPILNARLQRDLEQRKKEKIQEQFLQAQKMEAIALLAGGVAHDFNNLLTTILGNAQLALSDLREDVPIYGNILEILEAGERAKNLTRQLLTFSRREIRQPELLDVNKNIDEMAKMLRRLIREDIEVVIVPGSNLWKVQMDPTQLDQIIMNLVVNARDAMPEGGVLTIETANVELDRAYFEAHGIDNNSGLYVMLAVTDTGIGMDEETCKQVFEPFFTTKEWGLGTGLGLSTVYGIVKQNKGYIWVYSEPGRGTTFKVYLPKGGEEVGPIQRESVHRGGTEGHETVLIVEDNESVRKLVEKALKIKGYRVLEASDPKEAIEICRAFTGPIDLLLTDVIMPGMNGKELAESLRSQRPSIKVLFMSGYAQNIIMQKEILPADIHFIQKPFSLESLARKVREALEG
jgi:PAS domain S-box-containing protein